MDFIAKGETSASEGGGTCGWREERTGVESNLPFQ